MRLPDEKIELAASTDPDRPQLNVVHFDRDRGLLEATDGRMLATVPIEDGVYDDDDVTSNLDPDAIRQARKDLKDEIAAADDAEKADIRKRGAVIVARDHGVTLASEKFFPTPGDRQMEFPNIEALSFERDPRKYDQVVSLDASLLVRLAKAISRDGRVRIYIRRGYHGVFVEPVPREDRDHARDERRIPWGFVMCVRDANMDQIFGRKYDEPDPDGGEAARASAAPEVAESSVVRHADGAETRLD